jgi:hypothetical protein
MEVIRYLPVAALVLVVVVFLGRAIGWVFHRARLPFTRRPALLSAAELRFYRALLAAAPSGIVVFVKVRLTDLVAVGDGAWRRYGAPGSGMHADFVLADAATTQPRLVIELDDRSHFRADAQKRDAFKNAALDAAGLRWLRVRAAARYDVAGLRASIQAASHTE